MKFFTSDTHFADNKTLQIDMRPFKNSKQFDKYVIKTWNKQTTKEDTIYVIGDFVDCDGCGYDSWKKSIQYVKKLKASVVLILGNNEQRVIKYYFNNDFNEFKKYCLALGFKDVFENLIVKIKDIDFYLTHKPFNYNQNMLNLFGHTHRSGGLYKPFGFNVGCDINHFRLYSENDILYLLSLKEKFWNKDKHLNMKV